MKKYLSGKNEIMNPILNELKEIIETQILPDGDHINIPTVLYLEGLYERLNELHNQSDNNQCGIFKKKQSKV